MVFSEQEHLIMGNTSAPDSVTDKLLTKRFALRHVLVGVCYACCTCENNSSQAISYLTCMRGVPDIKL